MFERRGLSNSYVGIMRFELFRKVFEDVTAFLNQGRCYTGTCLAGFISFKNSLMLFCILIAAKRKRNEMAEVKKTKK